MADCPSLPPQFAQEPWSEEAARWRADRLPFRIPPDAQFHGGNSNDAWMFDGRVVRVCWRADRGRLLREAALLEELPSDVPHAEVGEYGCDEDVSWLVSPLLPGTPMQHLLPELTDARDLFRQLAGILEALHDWQPSPALAATLVERPSMSLDVPESVWPVDLVPLPIERVAAVATTAALVPYIDPGLIRAAHERILSLAEFDPFGQPPEMGSVIHGDATLANVLVRDGQITGLIDFEYARMGPRDLELLSPVLFGAAYGMDWLREDYPRLFEGENLRERLWL